VFSGVKGMDKETFVKKYIHHRSLLIKGHGEISLIWSVLSQTLIVWLALRDADTIHRIHAIWILPSIMLIALLVQYLIGWIWERNKLVDAEEQWRLERSPMIKQMKERLDK